MSELFRAVMACVVLAGIAQPAAARQEVRSTPDGAKSQVRTFEVALKAAVETGTRNFAKRATEMVPELFSVVDAPEVNGVIVHVRDRAEFVFHIQVPMIWPVMQVMLMNQRLMPGGGPAAAGTQPVGTRVGDAGSDADPVDGVNPSNRPELEREFGRKVRDALVDAILDNSAVLPIAAADTLVIFASVPDSGIPASLYQDPVPRKLVLSMTGADLTDLRQGRISRDEARTRVVEEHF